MANSYQMDLSTEPGAYLNGHPTTAKELRKGRQSGGTNPMARKKEPVKKSKSMVKGK